MDEQENIYRLTVDNQNVAVAGDWNTIYPFAYNFARAHLNYKVSIVNDDTGEILVDFQ